MKNNRLNALSDEAYYELAVQTTNMVIKGHLSPEKVYKIAWIARSTMYDWLAKRKAKWLKWLMRKNSEVWPKKSNDNNLTEREIGLLCGMISWEPKDVENRKVQDSWLFELYALRTIELIQKLILVVFEKDLKRWKVREIMDIIWFTNQKPVFKAYQQDSEKVKKWKEDELPKIKIEAKKEKREIYYWDEAGFRSNDQRWKTWAPKWQTPVVKSNWARFGVNAISAISPYGWLKFMVYDWSFNSDLLIEFMRRMIYNTKKKFTLILDGHPTHKTKKVEKFLISINYQIKLHILPWYSPELNPDEHIRGETKNDLKGRIFANKQELAAWVRSSLYKLQKNGVKVSKYFWDSKVGFMSK
jgi:transposase